MFERTLGKTGERLSVVGFGGIIVMNATTAEAQRDVAKAIERGITYFDVAPSYGNAEVMLGPALEPYRKDVFLACKTGEREAEGAQKELEQSLKHLRTDHFDLYQLHGVSSMEEVETILGKGGALETFIKAREQGLTRYLGFSAHSEEAALALMDRFDFDTILFPFNWVTWHQSHFGPRALAKAKEKNMGILALKALAKRQWGENEEHRWNKTWYSPVDSYEEALMGLRFTLSLGVTAATSPSHAELLWWMCDAADEYTPLSEAEAAEIERMGEGLAPIF